MTGTPAASSAATMAPTSSLVNWWRLWCEPSRSDVSVIRTSQIGLKKMSVVLIGATPPRKRAVPPLPRLRRDHRHRRGSWRHSSRRRGQGFFGDLFADLGGRGGHDVQVARIRRQIVASTLDLDKRGDQSLTAGVHRGLVELRLVEQ